jgi:hypothetical protein
MRPARPQARYSVNEADRSVVSWLTRPLHPGMQRGGCNACLIYPIFLIGFQLGEWCTGPQARDLGYKAGVWSRETLNLDGQP